MQAIKSEEEEVESAEESSAMETADAMFESLSLDTSDQPQPSTSTVTMKNFQSSGLKNKEKAFGGKKKKFKKKK